MIILYRGHPTAPHEEITARAERYGWKPSEAVTARAEPGMDGDG